MDKRNYRPRVIDKKIDLYLRAFGAICIEGPKWCGKTWSSLFHANSSFMLADPARNFQNRKFAELALDIVFDGEKPRLIDEWQEVPPIWDAVRFKVDENPAKGQFILTGSATPNHKGILHSGAGRIGKLRMRPMSLFESGASSGKVSLQALCKGEFKDSFTDEVSLKTLAELIVRGGWPANIDVGIKEAALLPKEYINAVLNDDIFRVDGVKRDLNKMRLLLHSLARNESTTASHKTLKNDIKEIDDDDIHVDTIKEYLNIFERLFILDNQLPFGSGVRSSVRVKQSVKRHFADPSLACALLNLSVDGLLEDLNTFGFLFEALCERDLKIYAEAADASLYHYQDYRGNEIDAVIELPNGEWGAFEIKLGTNQLDAAASNLLKIKKQFEEDEKGKPPKILCVICGLTNAAYRREDGVYVVPITALKD